MQMESYLVETNQLPEAIAFLKMRAHVFSHLVMPVGLGES
jgi:hypothetical protein